MYFSKLYCERAYIIAVKAREKYPGGMYINAEDPSRSLRGLNNDSDELVLIAGESHKTGQGKDLNNHYRALAEFAGDIFTIDDIPYRWSAQDCMTLDGIPYIGNYAPDTPDLYMRQVSRNGNDRQHGQRNDNKRPDIKGRTRGRMYSIRPEKHCRIS